MIKAKLTGSGIAPQAALNLGGTVTTGLTAAGTTQATAAAVSDDVNVVTTTAASSGVILRSNLGAGDSQTVVNYGANTLAVYPPIGGAINNGTVNAAATLAAGKTGVFTTIDGTAFFYPVSA